MAENIMDQLLLDRKEKCQTLKIILRTLNFFGKSKANKVANNQKIDIYLKILVWELHC